METNKMNFPQVREALTAKIKELKDRHVKRKADIFSNGVYYTCETLLKILEQDGNPELAEDGGQFKNLTIQEEVQIPRASAETLRETPKFTISDMKNSYSRGRYYDEYQRNGSPYEFDDFIKSEYGEDKVQTTNS